MSLRRYSIPDVMFFQEGPGVRNTQFTTSGIKLLNVGNINGGELNLSATKVYISEEEAYGRYKHFLVEDGDLLIGSSGITVDTFHKKIAWAKKSDLPLCLNTSTIRFRPLDKTQVDCRYFAYFLQTQQFKTQLRKLITGSAQLNFGPSHLKQMWIDLPPIEDQVQAANILDKADALLRLDQQVLKKHEELAQSIFHAMFGDIKEGKAWQKMKLKDVTLKITDGEHGTVKRLDAGRLYLMARNVRNSFIDLSEVSYISEDDHRRIYKRCNPEEGDLLLVCVGATIGRTSLVPQMEEFSLARSVALIKPKKDIIRPYYLLELFKTDYLQTQIRSSGNSSAQAGLYTGKIGELTVPVPPLELQLRFERELANVLGCKQLAESSQSESSALFNSLLQRAFS